MPKPLENGCCSVAQSCLTLCDPMDHSTPGFPVLHHLLEFAQTHVHWVGDAIQPSHPLMRMVNEFRTTPFAVFCSPFCCHPRQDPSASRTPLRPPQSLIIPGMVPGRWWILNTCCSPTYCDFIYFMHLICWSIDPDYFNKERPGVKILPFSL